MSNNQNNDFLSVDTIRVDDHLRVTMTKKLRKCFNVEEDDVIAIFQNKRNNDLVLKIQRESKVVDSWILRKATESDIEPQEDNKSSQDTIALTKGGVKRPNVLVIDDEPSVLLTFKGMLEDKFNVDVFKDSKEALEHYIKMNSSSYDVVITDLRMPSINGIQMYKRIKEIDSGIKVLFCSALDAAEEILSLFPEIKSSDILRKPILKKTLENTIESKFVENRS